MSLGSAANLVGLALQEGPSPTSGGAAVRLDGQLRLLGDTPPAARVTELVAAVVAAGVTATDAVAGVAPAAADLVDTASGVLAVPVGAGDFLAWFRPETLREVTWGGNPYASKVAQTDDMNDEVPAF